jgi:leucyl-tRNA synthetase
LKLVDSDFLNGLGYKEGTYKQLNLEKKLNQGKENNYRLRDAVFSSALLGRTVPVYYVNGLPQMIDGTFANYFTRSRKVFLPKTV